MSGAGKTYIGTRLADQLGFTFVDLDQMMESQWEKPLMEILEALGEEKFLLAEEEQLQQLRDCKNTVISTGGSIVYRPTAITTLKKLSTVVYLSCPLKVIEERRQAPVYGIVGLGKKTLTELYEERVGLYEQAADYKIEVANKTSDAIIETIQSYRHS